MPRILIVEDEAHLATGIKFNLEIEGYGVDVAADGHEALARLASAPAAERWDLVLLDVMLPGLDGFQVVSRMREGGDFTPVLMLTAKGQADDMVHGLEAGADDYLTKPFDLTVLLARVKGILRRRDWARGGGEEAVTARVGEASVDFRKFEVSVRGRRVTLTLLEAMLLKLLVQNAGRVVSKAEILEKVWNVSPDTETRAVDNFIMRLRRVLEANPRFPKHLHTVRGAGYKLLLEG
jgi:two-component system, OmpR family, alkaline phosphatase synthesis response regulator PhoP